MYINYFHYFFHLFLPFNIHLNQNDRHPQTLHSRHHLKHPRHRYLSRLPIYLKNYSQQ